MVHRNKDTEWFAAALEGRWSAAIMEGATGTMEKRVPQYIDDDGEARKLASKSCMAVPLDIGCIFFKGTEP